MRAANVLLLAIAAGAVFAAPAALAHKNSTDFERMDSNNDGVVSSSEHEVYARKMFDAIDTNHDDNVSAEERTAAEGKVPKRATGNTQYSAAARIRRHDTNADGSVSQSEQADGARQRFIMLDGDHNGSLTPQEYASGE